MSYVKALLASVAVSVAVIFMIQNIEALSHPLSLRLNLFFASLESTFFATYLIILLAFFVGLFAASMLGLGERFGLRRHIKNLNRDISGLNSELSSLRNLPLTSEPMVEAESLSAQGSDAPASSPQLALDEVSPPPLPPEEEKQKNGH